MQTFFYAAAIGVFSLTTLAEATPVTLTYDFDQQPDAALGCGFKAETGGVTGTIPNQCTYTGETEHVILGDDGWAPSATITADPGLVFDLITLDVLTLAENRRISDGAFSEYAALYEALSVAERPAYPDPVSGFGSMLSIEFLEAETSFASEVDPLTGLLVQGYSGASLVAETLLTEVGAGLTLGSAFTGLTDVRLTAVNGGGFYGTGGFDPSATILDGFFYSCVGQCLRADYDNAVLNIYAAAVPLPASSGLLGLGVAGLLAARRWKRSA